MTTSRIKDKLSQLVGSQLPEFIRSDFPTFVEFIERRNGREGFETKNAARIFTSTNQ